MCDICNVEFNSEIVSTYNEASARFVNSKAELTYREDAIFRFLRAEESEHNDFQAVFASEVKDFLSCKDRNSFYFWLIYVSKKEKLVFKRRLLVRYLAHERVLSYHKRE